MVYTSARAEKKGLLKVETIKLFQSAGLRVLFQLVAYPEPPIIKPAIQMPLRKLAEKAGVSLGSVHKAMADLEQLDYVIKLNEKQKKLNEVEGLVKKWIAAYGETLKPKLFQGKFRFVDEQARRQWRLLRLNGKKTRWGGEPAAANYTNHIQPEHFTLYTLESLTDVMRNYKLLPHSDGEIEVFPYPAAAIGDWVSHGQFTSVPPLLVYADLMTSTDPRNR